MNVVRIDNSVNNVLQLRNSTTSRAHAGELEGLWFLQPVSIFTLASILPWLPTSSRKIRASTTKTTRIVCTIIGTTRLTGSRVFHCGTILAFALQLPTYANVGVNIVETARIT